MQQCLEYICREFEKVKDYLYVPTSAKELIINNLFENFMKCFLEYPFEKKRYPKEFLESANLYNAGDVVILKRFEDVGMRFLLLSDFYDYVKITHLYHRN
ncbi:MAG: hypothetical protein PHN18_07675 [Sulfurospirillaceae bacterium]|jgi:hypothetical protein|nr:hypothetical protein [Sulfurospirillaceae bacterium]MDD2827271.1 hypothetical protein [Sulfurospirillaceae bacterium]